MDHNLARYIDHTLLKPEATETEIHRLCREAVQFRFAAVCVNLTWVGLCAKLLSDTGVVVGTVAGFPLGAVPAEIKACEARRAVIDGAGEVDMVLNIGRLKSGQDEVVLDEIRRAAEIVHEASAGLKIIIEAGLLTDEEKIRACVLARQGSADFVKTSTGFGSGGATVHDVALMRQAVGAGMGVKAAGGIRDLATARRMIGAGATRLGTSAGIRILQEDHENVS